MSKAYVEILSLLEKHDNPNQHLYSDGFTFDVPRTGIIPQWAVVILHALAELLEPEVDDPSQIGYNHGYH